MPSSGTGRLTPELDVVVEAQVRISVFQNVLCKSGTPRQVSMPSFVMPSNDARAAADIRASWIEHAPHRHSNAIAAMRRFMRSRLSARDRATRVTLRLGAERSSGNRLARNGAAAPRLPS